MNWLWCVPHADCVRREHRDPREMVPSVMRGPPRKDFEPTCRLAVFDDSPQYQSFSLEP
jgi:hypothetical protein